MRWSTVRTGEGDEDELALGAWRAGLQDEQATLEFGPAGAPPVFSLRCDARRGMLLQRHGAVPLGRPAGDAGHGRQRDPAARSGQRRRGDADAARGASGHRSVPRGARRRHRRRSSSGSATPRRLNLPPSPLVGAYATGCANGENQRRADVEAVANETAANQAAANQAARAAQ